MNTAVKNGSHVSEQQVRPLNLYDLTTDLVQLEHALLDAGGVIGEETEERFRDLLEMEADKVEGYIAMIRKFEASEEAIKSERKRLQKAERAMKNAARSLKDRLADAMLRRGEDCHKTNLGTVRVQRSGNQPIVLDVDPEELPDGLKRVTVKPDKTAIRGWLKQAEVEGITEGGKMLAHLGEPSYYLRIY